MRRTRIGRTWFGWSAVGAVAVWWAVAVQPLAFLGVLFMAAVAWWLIAGPEWIRDHDWNVVGEVHDKIEFWPWLTFALCLDLAAAVYLAISLSGWLLSTFTPWAPIWHDSARQMVNVTAAAIVANGWLYFTKGDTNG